MIDPIAHILGRHPSILLVLTASILVVSASCGKTGPPQPPLTRTPSRPNQVVAVQVGDVVTLTWSAPNLDLRESEAGSIRRADVYRLVQTRDTTPIAFDDDFEEGADIIGFLDYDTLKLQLKQNGRLRYDDQLDLSDSSTLANTRFLYAVRYVDGRGRPQAFSNIVSFEPVPGIARPPTDLVASEEQDRVILKWTPPAENIDGSVPAQIAGFNVYRAKPNAERLGRPINDRLLTTPEFVDRNFNYATTYVYVVRSVSQGPDQPVESADSERLEITPRDVFPPTTPTNVTLASANGVISLFWPTNPEQDVVGYYIYRRDAASTSEADWTRITANPVPRTTYRDETVRVGQQYAYRITAVDRSNNESPPSQVVTERASP